MTISLTRRHLGAVLAAGGVAAGVSRSAGASGVPDMTVLMHVRNGDNTGTQSVSWSRKTGDFTFREARGDSNFSSVVDGVSLKGNRLHIDGAGVALLGSAGPRQIGEHYRILDRSDTHVWLSDEAQDSLVGVSSRAGEAPVAEHVWWTGGHRLVSGVVSVSQDMLMGWDPRSSALVVFDLHDGRKLGSQAVQADDVRLLKRMS